MNLTLRMMGTTPQPAKLLLLCGQLSASGLGACAGGEGDPAAQATTSGIVGTGSSTGNTGAPQVDTTDVEPGMSGSGTATAAGTATATGGPTTGTATGGPTTGTGTATTAATDDTDGTTSVGPGTMGSTTMGSTTMGSTTSSGAERCGDGRAEGIEVCDGQDFGGKGCADFKDATQTAFTKGTLTCDVQCRVLTGGCTRCGNGKLEAGETCDGAAVGSATCDGQGQGWNGGVLTCNATCDGYDTAGCFTCGDGRLESAEDCEGDVGANTCASEGYAQGGSLTCTNACRFDVSNCCGDGTRGSAESCDCKGGNCTPTQLGNKKCTDFEASPGKRFSGGALGCSLGCGIDTSGCRYCGDGIRNDAEECDGDDFDGVTCSDPAFKFLGTGGSLGCTPDCKYDTSACVGPMCGEAVAPQSACPAICDNGCAGGVCEIRCDGRNFSSDTCHGVGWSGGELKCPDDWPCRVVCTDCMKRTITCPTGVGATCEIECLDMYSCWTATVNCQGTNACRLKQGCQRPPGSGAGGFNCNNSCDCDKTCP